MRAGGSIERWEMETRARRESLRAELAQIQQQYDTVVKQTEAREKGRLGEMLLAAEIHDRAQARYGWPVTYDRLIAPGRLANIDSIVVTPWVVLVLDAKATEADHPNPADPRLRVQMRSIHEAVEGVVCGTYPVATAAVFVGRGRPEVGTWTGDRWLGGLGQHLDQSLPSAQFDLRRMSWLFDRERARLDGRAFHTPDQMDAVFARIISGLPSATDHSSPPAAKVDWSVCGVCEYRIHPGFKYALPGYCDACFVDRMTFAKRNRLTCCKRCLVIVEDVPDIDFPGESELCVDCFERIDWHCDWCGDEATDHCGSYDLCWRCLDSYARDCAE